MAAFDRRRDRALEVLDECAAAASWAEFVRVALPGLHRLFGGGDEVSLCRVSPRFDTPYSAAAYPTPPHTLPDALQTLRTRFTEHPFSAHQRRHVCDLRARRLSELVSATELRRTPFYSDFYRPRGIAFAAYGVLYREPGRTVVVGFGRARRDYSDDEQQLLDRLLRPLGSLYLAAHVRERGSLGIGALTGAESRVAELVASGLTNRAVAGELGVSVKAVEQHLTHVYRRLGVRSRVQLALALSG